MSKLKDEKVRNDEIEKSERKRLAYELRKEKIDLDENMHFRTERS